MKVYLPNGFVADLLWYKVVGIIENTGPERRQQKKNSVQVVYALAQLRDDCSPPIHLLAKNIKKQTISSISFGNHTFLHYVGAYRTKRFLVDFPIGDFFPISRGKVPETPDTNQAQIKRHGSTETLPGTERCAASYQGAFLERSVFHV